MTARFGSTKLCSCKASRTPFVTLHLKFGELSSNIDARIPEIQVHLMHKADGV